VDLRCARLLQVGSAWSLIAAFAPAAPANAAPAATDIQAEPPSDLSVTVYRAPYRNSGSIDLDSLQGFALVSETRTVHLPAGTSRIRFEGVADGIEPASAIVTGLSDGIIEKNRDASLLSPEALIAASVGKPVELLRTNRKSGKVERSPGTILSDAGGGVVFQTAQGTEALRCSGLPETFSFTPTGALSAHPTLSVLVKSTQAITKQVTLSYLSRGFDWAADYTATLSADGKTLDLGAWVTLANANGVSFPSARTQVVAGKLNRENDEVEPIDEGGPIIANCWPRGSTSDIPAAPAPMFRNMQLRAMPAVAGRAPAALMESVVVAAQRVTEEQLGDLKLYRVPERTTVASRQSKQVRLMDRSRVPIQTVYSAELAANDTAGWAPAKRLLRTKNSAQNQLGLPLPSGSVAVFAPHGDESLLEHESGLRDTALDEELEIDMGTSSDVQYSIVHEQSSFDSAHAQMLPLVPGVTQLRSVKVDDVSRVDISNARSSAVAFELRLQLAEGARVIRADHPLGRKNGRPIFKLTVPANGTVTVRYQTQRSEVGVVQVR
jgi:hypothetical protein